MKQVLKEWFIEAPWGKIAAMSWGDPTEEPMLLVHGRQDSLSTFVPLLERLPDRYHFVAFDLPGHGKSDPLPYGTVLMRIHFVKAVEVVVEHLGWQKFVYVAHSFGGELGIFYAILHPNTVTRMVLLDSIVALRMIQERPWDINYKHYYDEYYSNYSKYNIDKRTYTKQRAIETVMKVRGLTREQAELVLERNLIPVGDDKYKLQWDMRLKNLAPINMPNDVYAEIMTKNCPPTLFLIAKRSLDEWATDNVIQLIEELQRKAKLFQVVKLDAGHDLHLTNTEGVADIVNEFLNRNMRLRVTAKLHENMKKVLKEWYVSAPWGKIAVVSWGDPTKQPLLLVHGRQDSAFTFCPLIDSLIDSYHIVALDLPGHGLSDALPVGVQPVWIQMIHALELVVQDLGWKKFIYMGHSMGGEFGTFYAALHPGRITRMIQIDSVPIIRSLQSQSWPEFYATFYQEYYDNYKKYNQPISERKSYTKQKAIETVMKSRKLTREQAELVLERNLRDIGNDLYKLQWDPRLKILSPITMPPATYFETVTKNAPPTLYLVSKDTMESYGKLQEKVLNYLETLKRECKSFKVVMYEGGHNLHFTDPDNILECFGDFLVRDFSVKAKL